MCSEHKEYYPSGQIRLHEIKNSDGHIHGERKLWHENGQLARRCFYTDGKLNGLMEEWYADGTRRVRQFCVNGWIHGKVVYFSSRNGQVMEMYFQYERDIVGEFLVPRFDRYHEHVYCKDGKTLFNLTFRLKMTLLHIKHKLRDKVRKKFRDSFNTALISDLAKIITSPYS